MSSRLKLIGSKSADNDVFAPVKEMSLDDLYTEAQELGKVEIGRSFTSSNSASINASFTGRDLVILKCEKHNTEMLMLHLVRVVANKIAEQHLDYFLRGDGEPKPRGFLDGAWGN